MPTPNVAEPQLFFGPMLIGVFLNTFLYGMLVVQAYHYFEVYKSDRPWIRYLVVYLLVLETANTGCMMEMIYDVFILNFLGSKPEMPPKPPILLSADALLTVLVSTPVQLFMAYRVKVLADSRFIPLIIGCFSLASLGGGIATIILVITIPDFSKFNLYYPSLITMLGSASVADVMIAGILAVTLYRKQTGLGVMDTVIRKIILFTVETGVVTAAFAVANLVIILLTTTGFNFIPDLALSKLYANTLLVSLNARADLVETLKGPATTHPPSKMINTAPSFDHVGTPTVSTRPSLNTTLVSSDPHHTHRDARSTHSVYSHRPHGGKANGHYLSNSSSTRPKDIDHGWF